MVIFDTDDSILLQIAGASLFGVLLSKYESVTCLKFAAGLMMWSLPFAVIGLLVTFCFSHSWLENKYLHFETINFQYSDNFYMVNQQAFFWGS